MSMDNFFATVLKKYLRFVTIGTERSAFDRLL